MKEIRLFEAFAGYGSQLLALRRIESFFPGEIGVIPVGISEIDTYALKAYEALHGDVTNYGDISKIDWHNVPDFDLFTMSSPCQDFSQAGLQRGGDEGSGTRSSLLWECTKAVEIKRPKYVLFENVAALVSQKFIKGFNKWQERLEGFGYKNFAKLINAKDMGVPQNRLRIFMISILRTDDDPEPMYHFPAPFPLETCLADVLDEDVDEKYFLSDEMLCRFCERSVDEDEQKCGDERDDDFENMLV